jgi:hypothetical protein
MLVGAKEAERMSICHNLRPFRLLRLNVLMPQRGDQWKFHRYGLAQIQSGTNPNGLGKPLGFTRALNPGTNFRVITS